MSGRAEAPHEKQFPFVPDLADGDWSCCRARRNAIPSVETILLRMAQARMDNRARLRPYTVIRHYNLLGKEKQTTGLR